MFSAYKQKYKPQIHRIPYNLNPETPGTPLVGVTAQTFLQSQKAKHPSDSTHSQSNHKSSTVKRKSEADSERDSEKPTKKVRKNKVKPDAL